MPGAWIKLPNGGFAHIRFAKTRMPKCDFCDYPSTLLCDFPVREYTALSGEIIVTKTCDARICARCATPVGPDKDYCPGHAH